MQISICEKMCGKTSLEEGSDIKTLSIRLIQNGDAATDKSIDVCRECRDSINKSIESLFIKPTPNITVSRRFQG